MHAVISQVRIDPSRREEARKLLGEVVVPQAKARAGFSRGTWLRSLEDDRGTSVLLFDSEDTARAALEQIRQGPPPGGPSTFVSADLFEVVAQA